MKRIIWHWTAGSHKASDFDRGHYHLLIEGDGKVVYGSRAISANAAPLGKNYVAHTAGLNTDSIGISVCAMGGARQAPFDPGDWPITTAQLETLVRETARLARGYNIPVTRQTVLSHAEVQTTLGVKQAGKWDIAWVPGWASATDPTGVGDYLRRRVQDLLSGHPSPPVKPVVKPVITTTPPRTAKPVPPIVRPTTPIRKEETWWQRLLTWLFGR